jgi:hypothetical protein
MGANEEECAECALYGFNPLHEHGISWCSLGPLKAEPKETWPCPLCGGKVKSWCVPRDAKAHPYCASVLALELRTLARNLAMAGGLCAAFAKGDAYATWRCGYFDGYYNDDTDRPWRPGCGRAVR